MRDGNTEFLIDMNFSIRKIQLSIDKQWQNGIDYKNENTDVIVEMQGGDIYVASFFSYDNIATMVKEHKISGEFLNGKYYWADGMVLVEKCDLEEVEEVVQYLIEEGDFQNVFRKL